jgi:hypothetical protein
MFIIQNTGWTLHYLTHEISMRALLTLITSKAKKEPKATGLLAQPNLDMGKLKEMGFDIV